MRVYFFPEEVDEVDGAAGVEAGVLEDGVDAPSLFELPESLDALAGLPESPFTSLDPDDGFALP